MQFLTSMVECTKVVNECSCTVYVRCAPLSLVEPTISFLLLEGMRNFGATRCTEREEGPLLYLKVESLENILSLRLEGDVSGRR